MEREKLVCDSLSINQYAASIASTWIWAPAIFVASSISYTHGLLGLALFLIPNIATLILFGFISNYVRNKQDGITVLDGIQSACYQQKVIHLIVSLVVLVCSTTVQLLAIKSLWNIPEYISIGATCLLALVITLSGGIKTCIQSDFWKYVVTTAISFGLLIVGCTAVGFDFSNVSLVGSMSYDPIDFCLSFGVVTALGLFSAPYIDQTFWQRAFSIPKQKVVKTFCLAGLYFAIIPICFGLIGLIGTKMSQWSLANQFVSGIPAILMSVAVFFILLATIDSNLCALQSYVETTKIKQYISSSVAMVLLCIASGIVIYLNPTLAIAQLFLIYGTIRTCMAVPTLLIVFNKYDSNRLLYATILSCLIAPIGYILTGSFWFTVFGFVVPVLGIKLAFK